jgi:predicted RNA binding protein YcfA (HicA-like mRNA interferase family)
MSRRTKLLNKLLNAESDTNWSLDDMELMLGWYGFECRAGKGSHRVFARPGKPGTIVLTAHGTKIKVAYVAALREQIAAIIEEQTNDPSQ